MNQNSSNFAAGSDTFYTDLQHENKDAENLLIYASNLDKKIQYAKWKQKLLLNYNYMPLKDISEKIETERSSYLKKIAEEEKRCGRMLSGQQLTVQLDLFRSFSKKLTSKLREIETQIENQRIKKKILAADAEDKRARLKEIVRENMQLSKMRLLNEGITSQRGLGRLFRSQSIRMKPYEVTQRPTERKTFTKRKNEKSLKNGRSNSAKRKGTQIVYLQCLNKVVEAIKRMKTSDDVQSGIYLQVMAKRTNQQETRPKYSQKSQIFNTLYSKYGKPSKTDSKEAKTDFDMDWDTFRTLNYKQIMGIVLVKDPKCEKLKQLLE